MFNGTQTEQNYSLIPKDLFKRILNYATLKIQKILSAPSECSLSVRWRFGEYKEKIYCVSFDSIWVCDAIELAVSKPRLSHKIVSFSRNFIFTDTTAFCAHSGRIIAGLDRERDLDMLTSLDYTSEGYITGWKDGTLRFGDARNQEPSEITVVHTFRSRVFSGTEGGDCTEWSNIGQIKKTYPHGPYSVTSITCDNDHVVIAYEYGLIACYSPSDKCYKANTEHSVFSLHILNGSFIFSGHEDGRVRIWTIGLKYIKSIQTGGVVTAISVLEDMLAIGLASGAIEVFNWQTTETIRQFHGGHGKVITHILINEDNGAIISSSLDGTIRVRCLN